MRHVLLLASLLGCLVVGLALQLPAAEKKDPPKKVDQSEARFNKLDKNKDGKLTLEEFTAEARKNKIVRAIRLLEAEFKKLDKDKNGSLSLEEYREFKGLKPADD